MKKKNLFSTISALTCSSIFAFYSSASIAEVVMTEGDLEIPTYVVGESEKTPIFYLPYNYQGAQYRIYPYEFIDKLSNEKKSKKYKALFLENEYIKLCILPEIGGRVYYAVDKTNGYNLVYHNQVIKPALVGMTGAWTSGGLEWNIPHHHRASTFSNVDYKLESNPDGSKTIWVGEYEKRHGMRWSVGTTLKDGESVIRTDIKVNNSTPVLNSFLVWANMAVHADENYKVVFPPDVERSVYHAKVEFASWPIAKEVYQSVDYTKGVDVSLWKNTSSPASFFAYGSEMDFMGGIDMAKQVGTVLVGDHNYFPGKKFWNWGDNDIARLWDQSMLTDSDGSYLELMMGAFSDNQPDYSWLEPYAQKDATMYYFPVRGMASIKNANSDAAVNLELVGDSVDIEALTTKKMSGKLVLKQGQKIVHQESVDISPDKPFSKSINAKISDDAQLSLSLLDNNGLEIISYTTPKLKGGKHPEVYQLPGEPESFSSAELAYRAGLRLEQFHNPKYDPQVYYKRALEIDPNLSLANLQMGIARLKEFSFDKAETYLRKAVAAETANYTTARNGEAWYYLGLALQMQKKNEEAKSALYKASLDDRMASAALTELARLENLSGNQAKSIDNARLALRSNGTNNEARVLLAKLLRAKGPNAESNKLVDDAISSEPLNFIARLEKTREANGKLEESAIQTVLGTELDNYLNSSARLIKAGFLEDAKKILTSAKSDSLLGKNPLIHFYMAKIEIAQGELNKARDSIKRANTLSHEKVFPHGWDTYEVLLSAHKLLPTTMSSYLLGNLLVDSQPLVALEYWKKAEKLPSGLVDRNMAFVYANSLGDGKKAISLMKSALEKEPTNAVYLSELDKYQTFAKVSPEKRLEKFEKFSSASHSDDTFIKLITLYIATGKYTEAINILNKNHFNAFERTDFNLHSLMVDAYVLRGRSFLEKKDYQTALGDFTKAMEFPRNLETAVDSKVHVVHYYLGAAYQGLGDSTRAREHFEKGSAYKYYGDWAGQEWPEVMMARARSFEALGKKQEAKKLYEEARLTGEKLRDAQAHPAEFSNSSDLKILKQRALADAYLYLAIADLGLGNGNEFKANVKRAHEAYPSLIGLLYVKN